MTADELRQEIEQTRQSLGETVDELAAKADIKARAGAKATEAKARVRDRIVEVSGRVSRSKIVQRRWPLVLVVSVLAAGAGTMSIWRWKKQA